MVCATKLNWPKHPSSGQTFAARICVPRKKLSADQTQTKNLSFANLTLLRRCHNRPSARTSRGAARRGDQQATAYCSPPRGAVLGPARYVPSALGGWARCGRRAFACCRCLRAKPAAQLDSCQFSPFNGMLQFRNPLQVNDLRALEKRPSRFSATDRRPTICGKMARVKLSRSARPSSGRRPRCRCPSGRRGRSGRRENR